MIQGLEKAAGKLDNLFKFLGKAMPRKAVVPYIPDKPLRKIVPVDDYSRINKGLSPSTLNWDRWHPDTESSVKKILQQMSASADEDAHQAARVAGDLWHPYASAYDPDPSVWEWLAQRMKHILPERYTYALHKEQPEVGAAILPQRDRIARTYHEYGVEDIPVVGKILSPRFSILSSDTGDQLIGREAHVLAAPKL